MTKEKLPNFLGLDKFNKKVKLNENRIDSFIDIFILKVSLLLIFIKNIFI